MATKIPFEIKTHHGWALRAAIENELLTIPEAQRATKSTRQFIYMSYGLPTFKKEMIEGLRKFEIPGIHILGGPQVEAIGPLLAKVSAIDKLQELVRQLQRDLKTKDELIALLKENNTLLKGHSKVRA